MNNNERRYQIINAAKECFISKGYKETGMRDISNEAGVALGTIYSYFKNKKELFDALNMPELAEFRPDYNRKKDFILSKALDLFARDGYNNVTMETISDACHVTRSVLYQYFPSKEDLFKNIIIQNQAVVYTENLASLDTVLPLKTILEDVAKKYFQFTKKKKHLILFKEVSKNSEKFPELIDLYYEHNLSGPCQNLAFYIARYCNDHGVNVTDIEKLRRHVAIFLSSLQNYMLTRYVICGIQHMQDEKTYIQSAVSVFVGYLKNEGYIS